MPLDPRYVRAGRRQALAGFRERSVSGAFRLTVGSLDLAAVVAKVTDERVGTIATFLGTVRTSRENRDSPLQKRVPLSGRKSSTSRARSGSAAAHRSP